MALPMPRAPPVISATFPSNSFIVLIFSTPKIKYKKD
jgi:hypothetical protein